MLSEEKEGKEFKEKEVIWAKVIGYPWWPGFIKTVVSNCKYKVEFLGEITNNFLSNTAIKKWSENFDNFKKGVKQLKDNKMKKKFLMGIELANCLLDKTITIMQEKEFISDCNNRIYEFSVDGLKSFIEDSKNFGLVNYKDSQFDEEEGENNDNNNDEEYTETPKKTKSKKNDNTKGNLLTLLSSSKKNNIMSGKNNKKNYSTSPEKFKTPNKKENVKSKNYNTEGIKKSLDPNIIEINKKLLNTNITNFINSNSHNNKNNTINKNHNESSEKKKNFKEDNEKKNKKNNNNFVNAFDLMKYNSIGNISKNKNKNKIKNNAKITNETSPNKIVKELDLNEEIEAISEAQSVIKDNLEQMLTNYKKINTQDIENIQKLRFNEKDNKINEKNEAFNFLSLYLDAFTYTNSSIQSIQDIINYYDIN